MEYNFTRSVVVIGQLAKESSRTPPPTGSSPFEYVDQSLTILGRTLDTHSQRIRQESLGQRDFIAAQFREFEKKVDGRFTEMDTKFDGRFKEMDKRVDGRFTEIDKRFNETDKKIEAVDQKMREYLKSMQNASRNILRTRGWEAISPVGSFNPQGGLYIPKHFPRTVRHFWRLKDPPQSEQPARSIIDSVTYKWNSTLPSIPCPLLQHSRIRRVGQGYG